MENMYNKIAEDIMFAMKSGDTAKRDCLRMVVSDIKNITVNEGKEITDEACMKVLRKQEKMHADSVAQFKAAGRDGLVAKEEAELAIIRTYLPANLSPEASVITVEKIITANKIEKSKKCMGQIMKLASQIPGIDKKAVSQHLSKELK